MMRVILVLEIQESASSLDSGDQRLSWKFSWDNTQEARFLMKMMMSGKQEFQALTSMELIHLKLNSIQSEDKLS